MNAARLVMPALRWNDLSGFRHEDQLIASALEVGVGGFIIFGGTAEAVGELTAKLIRDAGRHLLIASDLERGAGQQFDGLTQLPPPRALAALDQLSVTRWAGAMTAREARAIGVNWVFAPVADLDLLPSNPIVQTRAFAAEPELASRHVAAWIEGCQGQGALACAKHYPGHGRTSADSHITLPMVDASLEELAVDRRPFRAAIGAGVASMMTAHVGYPALDPSRLPATLSKPILDGLRDDGFDGLVVTDALIMEGAHIGRTEAEAAVDALAAGADILLYPTDSSAVAKALTEAIESGRLATERVADALRRYDAAIAMVEAGATEAIPASPFEGAPALADALVAQGEARGRVPVLRQPIQLITVDDDLGGPYPPVPSDAVLSTLDALGVATGVGGSRVVLAFAEPRAWKGRAGFGEASRAALGEVADADLVVLFGHPRLVGEIPGSAAVLVAWHRQRLMQGAVGRWLASRVR